MQITCSQGLQSKTVSDPGVAFWKKVVSYIGVTENLAECRPDLLVGQSDIGVVGDE